MSTTTKTVKIEIERDQLLYVIRVSGKAVGSSMNKYICNCFLDTITKAFDAVGVVYEVRGKELHL